MQLIEPPASLLNGASLFLDFDGTLVELASEPGAVEVGEDLLALLVTLIDKLEGRVALLSGRAADDVSRLVRRLELPIGGSHGLERLSPRGMRSSPPRPAGLDEVVAALRALEVDFPGVQIEEKPAGVAVHYRRAPHAEAACHEAAEHCAMAIGMSLQHGKMVVELKLVGADKGSALRSFMAEAPFAGTRPVFIGDDLTDEHGFVAVREFNGEGVLVGPRRPTAAIYGLEDVTAVRSWLEAALEALP